MYFLLTSYTLVMFLKVLSHFIMKIKNFMKYFKEGVLKYFKISMKFLHISKRYFIVHPCSQCQISSSDNLGSQHIYRQHFVATIYLCSEFRSAAGNSIPTSALSSHIRSDKVRETDLQQWHHS